jgi:hypothetical protein
MEGQIVDRAIEERRRLEPLQAERGDHGVCFPVAARRVIMDARAAETPAKRRSKSVVTPHSSRNRYWRMTRRRPQPPLAPFGGDVGPPLFIGVGRFS